MESTRSGVAVIGWSVFLGVVAFSVASITTEGAPSELVHITDGLSQAVAFGSHLSAMPDRDGDGLSEVFALDLLGGGAWTLLSGDEQWKRIRSWPPLGGKRVWPELALLPKSDALLGGCAMLVKTWRRGEGLSGSTLSLLYISGEMRVTEISRDQLLPGAIYCMEVVRNGRFHGAGLGAETFLSHEGGSADFCDCGEPAGMVELLQVVGVTPESVGVSRVQVLGGGDGRHGVGRSLAVLYRNESGCTDPERRACVGLVYTATVCGSDVEGIYVLEGPWPSEHRRRIECIGEEFGVLGIIGVGNIGDITGDGISEVAVSDHSLTYCVDVMTDEVLYCAEGGANKFLAIPDWDADGIEDFVAGAGFADDEGSKTWLYSGATGEVLQSWSAGRLVPSICRVSRGAHDAVFLGDDRGVVQMVPRRKGWWPW